MLTIDTGFWTLIKSEPYRPTTDYTYEIRQIDPPMQPTAGIHSHRASGGDRDHRHSGQHAFAGAFESQNESHRRALHEQHQANSAGVADVQFGQ